MKQILLMRHGEAQESPPGSSDFDRPLTAKGRQQAQDMANQLQDVLPAVDAVFCSPAVRTRETLAGFYTQTIVPYYVDDLYHAPMRLLLEKICELEEKVCLPLFIGHNPGLAQFVMTLAPEHHGFPPAAVALLTVKKEIPWGELSFQGMRVEKVFYPRL
jgi:phosphohistidine phosphatase